MDKSGEERRIKPIPRGDAILSWREQNKGWAANKLHDIEAKQDDPPLIHGIHRLMDQALSQHLHLVSDATGETITALARACLVQFDKAAVQEHLWPLVRTAGQVEKVLDGIAAHPGLVLYTIVNPTLRQSLEEGCRLLQVPTLPILDPVLRALEDYLGAPSTARPGRQHELDAEYFNRIEAMNFALAHDDGQASKDYHQADVILVGVSRTSKTPTSLYLANRGIRAANVPIVPGCPLPPELETLQGPLVVGLTKDPVSLVHIRRNRLRMMTQDEDTDYVNPEIVKQEVATARRLCAQHDWPVIDVTRRSIEETAAAIMQLLNRHRGEDMGEVRL